MILYKLVKTKEGTNTGIEKQKKQGKLQTSLKETEYLNR